MKIQDIAKSINGVSYDSKSIVRGNAYVAIRGSVFNGEDFIQEAIENGAVHIILQASDDVQTVQKGEVLFHYVDNPRFVLAALAAAYYAEKPKNIVAITGTNGKTSTAHFFAQIANQANFKSASIGTLGLTSNDDLEGLKHFVNDDNLTSPNAVTTHAMLQALARHGFSHIAIEASSHGLIQYRLDCINFKAVAFTNLTRDHLDYHGTMSAYFDAKKILFERIADNDTVFVLNSDVAEYDVLKNIALKKNIKIITYGKKAQDIKIIKYREKELQLEFFGKVQTIDFVLEAEFQVYNACCAAGLAIACGIDDNIVLNSLSNLQYIAGRMEKVAPNIYVDYAHTPDALKRVLTDLRSLCKGRLILVFGCGGDRDQGKRETMGIIAEEIADVVIVTDDNPRNENPEVIRAAILASMKNGVVIADRAEAIEYGISLLNTDDTLLIAGKGHEEYQIIGNDQIYFSDRGTILKILSK